MKHSTGYIERSCKELSKSEESDRNVQHSSQPLANFREQPAYLLLGDPGLGKSRSFEHEAAASEGIPISARDFLNFDIEPDWYHKPLFIDGLDEIRAGSRDGLNPLDTLRARLHKIRPLRFRISCREADWYGDMGLKELSEFSSDGKLVPLRLEPFTEKQSIDFLTDLSSKHPEIGNPTEFYQEAEERRLEGLLHNPQLLENLVRAYAQNQAQWPDTLTDTMELACRSLLSEHRPSSRHRDRITAPNMGELLETAGLLCAVHLISDKPGFANELAAEDMDHPYPVEWPLVRRDLVLHVLATKLFQAHGSLGQFSPIHRVIAEYLAARHLASLIDKGLPEGRVLALITGSDGIVVNALRGLSGWLATLSPPCRQPIIQSDPMGMILYGEIARLPREGKIDLIRALDLLAMETGRCREGFTASKAFAPLATGEMLDFLGLRLSEPAPSKATQLVMYCLTDALLEGEINDQIEAQLQRAIQGEIWWPGLRSSFLDVLCRHRPHSDGLRELIQNILAGKIVDENDELLGTYLSRCYPAIVSPSEVFNFFHPAKNERLIGSYSMFWSNKLLAQSGDGDLIKLMDYASDNADQIAPIDDQFRFDEVRASILEATLNRIGDSATDDQLYRWISSVFAPPLYVGQPSDTKPFISWLSNRQSRILKLLSSAADACVNQIEFSRLNSYLLHLIVAATGREQSSSMLSLLHRNRTDFGNRFIYLAAFGHHLRWNGASAINLDELQAATISFPEVRDTYESLTQTELSPDYWNLETNWRLRTMQSKQERAAQDIERIEGYRENEDTIRKGGASVGVLEQLGRAYLGLFPEFQEDSAIERLSAFFNGDKSLVSTALGGLEKSLSRKDLPSPEEISDTHIKSRHFLIQFRCLAGAESLESRKPGSIQALPKSQRDRLLAFYLADGSNKEPTWLSGVIQAHPRDSGRLIEKFAKSHLRARQNHIPGIYPLTHEDGWKGAALVAVPELLSTFPVNASDYQLSGTLVALLGWAFKHMEPSNFIQVCQSRLSKKTMLTGQRGLWLTAGLFVEFSGLRDEWVTHFSGNQHRLEKVSGFIRDLIGEHAKQNRSLNPELAEVLIDHFGPIAATERDRDSRYDFSKTQIVTASIDRLSSSDSQAVEKAFERLLANDALEEWWPNLRRGLRDYRSGVRELAFTYHSVESCLSTLSNQAPANPADLAALAMDHLRDYARKVKDDNRGEHKNFWQDEGETPKHENDCRDVVMKELQDRLLPHGVDAIKEGYHRDDKRADMVLSSMIGDRPQISIEVKKNMNKELWTGVIEQLELQYARAPRSDGYGIYLVLWMQPKRTPPHASGGQPKSAQELEERLCGVLSREQRARLSVCVIDCTWGAKRPFS